MPKLSATRLFALVTFKSGRCAEVEFDLDSPLSSFTIDKLDPDVESVEILSVVWESN